MVNASTLLLPRYEAVNRASWHKCIRITALPFELYCTYICFVFAVFLTSALHSNINLKWFCFVQCTWARLGLVIPSCSAYLHGLPKSQLLPNNRIAQRALNLKLYLTSFYAISQQCAALMEC